MNYNAFVEEIARLAREAAGEGREVTLRHIVKNNGTEWEGITIRNGDARVSPTIYLQNYYDQYRNGVSPKEIAESILREADRLRPEDCFDPHVFFDPEKAERSVVRRLVNREKNEALLREVPHRAFLDLEITYQFFLENLMEENGCIQIRSEHTELWNMTEDQLYEASLENMRRLVPCHFAGMQDMMRELLQSDLPELDRDESPLYVLTNRAKWYGAAWITDPGTLKMIGNTLGRDYYILPSSVHECMILPAEACYDVDALSRMVREINLTQVPAEEILADSVYLYERAERSVRQVR